MRRVCVALIVACAATVLADEPKFLSVWKSPDVSRLNFAGKKVAALVITDDQSLQMSGEEALVRELTARGVNGIATYRIVPAPELKTAEKAKGWFERSGVQGVVAMRPLSQQREKKYSPVVWSSGYYQSCWGYYDYGWSSVAVARVTGTTTTVLVETLVFDATHDRLVWAATSATRDAKSLQVFVKDLVSEAVKEMQKMKLVG